MTPKTCTLRKGIERWPATMSARGLNLNKVIDRELFPSEYGMFYQKKGDGLTLPEKIIVKAFPLTLDEYNYYSYKAPSMKEADKEWWLRTQDAAGYRYAVSEDGSLGSYQQNAINAVRPAMVILTNILCLVR